MTPQPPVSPRANRFLAGLPCLLSIPGQDVTCRAHNLSRTGVSLSGHIPSFAVSEVSLRIRNPAGDLRLTVAARVIRRDEDPEGEQTVLGVEFVAIPRSDLPALDALIARLVEGVSPAALEDLPETATRQEIRAALEQVTVPHRTVLATRGQPKMRGFLIQDPSPVVVDGLARNPGLLLHELLTILRMPNLLPHTLEAIGKDPRWTANAQVMNMVATHRNTPLGAADKIVSRMSTSALERVILASGLKPMLRIKILQRLKR
jgi:hypothetical protein